MSTADLKQKQYMMSDVFLGWVMCDGKHFQKQVFDFTKKKTLFVYV